MATLVNPLPTTSATTSDTLDKLADDFLDLVNDHLDTLTPERRAAVIADIHATAEDLRAKH